MQFHIHRYFVILIHMTEIEINRKKVIVFDLDGTLTESKKSLDSETADLLSQLLYVTKVGIVSGGGFKQLKTQVIDELVFNTEKFKNFFIFPTKGAQMYTFTGTDWAQKYKRDLSFDAKEKIRAAFEQIYTSNQFAFLPKEHFGDVLEDRDSQFTFSALGQDAPVELKKVWDPDAAKRQELRRLLKVYLPEFEVEIGGATSIDITEKGIDKAFALEQLCTLEHFTIAEILYIGDALFVGGNDYAVVKTGVDTIAVKDYNETKEIIKKIIAEK
jgi:phosphomannomutase